MAILQNDPTVERIETGGITSVREFVFGDNEDVFVPVGIAVPISFLIFSAVVSPINKLYSFLI